MKRIVATIIVIISICLMLSACGGPEGTKINEENFPDENFRNYLLSENYGEDKVITDEEISSIKEIDVANMEISDLTGLEYFCALEELSCTSNRLHSIDVSQNTSLIRLFCGHNELETLDVSANVNIEFLYCHSNKLKTLDVSNNQKLTELNCSNNLLKEDVNIDNNPNLTNFESDFSKFPSKNNTDATGDYDNRVKEGMSRSQVESLWGAPAQTSVKVFSDGTLTYCWYYDANGTYRWVIYNSNNIVASVF